MTLKRASRHGLKPSKPYTNQNLLKPSKTPGKKICEKSTKTTPWKMYEVCKAGFTRQLVPSSLTLQNGSTTTSEKETASALLHKFFPDDSTAQDSGKQRKLYTF
jgi:hypothetical protein